MRKDLKTGMLIGVVLVIGAVVVISVWPGGTIESRFGKSKSSRKFYEPAQNIATETGQETFERKERQPTFPEPEPAPAQALEQQRDHRENSVSVTSSEQLRIHVVAQRETLSSISMMYYDDRNKWRKIADANPRVITDLHKLRPGARLVIPR